MPPVSAYAIGPGHSGCGSGFKHHNGVRVGRDHLINQLVLVIRQCEVGQIVGFMRPLIGKDNGDLGFLCQRSGGCWIRARVKPHLRTRSHCGNALSGEVGNHTASL